MCGLVGVAGNLLPIHRKVLNQLLMVDSVRGEDSTGVAFINKFTGNTHVSKEVGDPFALLYSNKYNKLLDMTNKVAIGHNRYATSGDVNKNNAHPFDMDTLVGVHNGTLNAKWKLEDHLDFKVDSENLYHHIEKRGLQDAISKLDTPNNAWSLVWWDKLEETLNFLRNKERPMYMCRSEDKQVLFWASEPWMLHGVLSRNGIKYSDVFITDEDIHYSIPINNKGEMSKPTTKRVAAPVYIAPKVHTNFFTAPTTTVSTTKPPVVGNVVQLPKKGEVVSNADASYVNSKNLLLEILSVEKDSSGADFLVLFDAAHPYMSIRVYPRFEDKHLKTKIGSEITGDISSFVPAANNGSYYKVSPWTIKEVFPVTAEVLYEDINGYPLNRKEWKRQYSLCGYCSDELDPDRQNRFTSGGDCLCPSCVTNKEVTQYVNLK